MATLAISSDANDRLTEFKMYLQGITLTSQAGTTVSLMSAPQEVEFIHVNGTLEPRLTISIPQGTYSSASVDVGGGTYSCVTYDSSGNFLNFAANEAAGTISPSSVTVTLSAPLAINSDSIGLTLKLLVGQSVETPMCVSTSSSVVPPVTITPAFTLSSFPLAIEPASPQNGALRGLDGQVEMLNAASGSFQIMLQGYPTDSSPSSVLDITLSITTDAATVWQGVTDLSALQAGEFVDLDGALQPDGSVRATRVAVMDPTAMNVQSGQVVFIGTATPPVFTMLEIQEQGQGVLFTGGSQIALGTGTTFGISGQVSNLETLPFAPDFSAASMVAGENVYVSTPAYYTMAPPDYNAVATTITLMPQTVDATVSSAASSGNFTVYTVSLARYDLFPNLATQSGQATLLTSPNVMYVYADSSTEVLSSAPPSPGDILRFYGLVFNDGGTLRMDCLRILDGVAM